MNNIINFLRSRRLDYLIPGAVLLAAGAIGTSLRGSDYFTFIIIGVIFLGLGSKAKHGTPSKRSRLITTFIIVFEVLSVIALTYFSRKR